MTWRVILSPAARREFDAAYADYESKREGLGDEFAQCVQDQLHALVKNPRIHAQVYKEARKAVVKRFPYCIYYLIEADSVQVISVFHTSRNPRHWQKRV